jgi:putative ABC transport system permease protein
VRFADVFRFALGALRQQKVRTVLTALGVVISSFVLVLSVSIQLGVQDAVGRQFRRHDRLRHVEVYSGGRSGQAGIPKDQAVINGTMSEAKRERLRQAQIHRWTRQHGSEPNVALTPRLLRELEDINHVASVVPYIEQQGRATFGDKAADVTCSAAPPGDPQFADRIVAGRFFNAADDRAVVVSEYLLYLWGIHEDEKVQQVLNRQVELELHSGVQPAGLLLQLLKSDRAPLNAKEKKILEKALHKLPEAVATQLEPDERQTLQDLLKPPPGSPKVEPDGPGKEKFTIVGVVRSPVPEDRRSRWPWMAMDEDILLPQRTAEELLTRFSAIRQQGFSRAAITVDSEDHVKEVTQKVAARGLSYFSLADILERIQWNVVLISFAVTFVAAVALVVAALGIINTMLMSVLERTHEIGVMKAVGARDGHIQGIFLVEGAIIGVVGGFLGLLLSWFASFPGDAIAQSLMEKQTQTPLVESLFAFPLWLTLGVPLFTGLVTTLAAVVPARRAARVSPVTALRHE